MTQDDPLLACLAGRITPALAIARMLLAGDDEAAIRRRVRALPGSSAAQQELDHLAQQDPLLRQLRCMLDAARVDHAQATTLAEIAAAFDRAVAISPEASVAFYSLGDAVRLQAVTHEIRDWLRQMALLGPDSDVLDLGCGIGRIAAAIAPSVRMVLGIDIAKAMLWEAKRRCAGLGNVGFAVASGLDLAMLADATFDLVLAVDAFPYLMQEGVAEHHVAEAARVLRPAGHLVVLNLSYRNCPDADSNDARTWARRYGFALRQTGASPFPNWDATVHIFSRQRPGGTSGPPVTPNTNSRKDWHIAGF